MRARWVLAVSQTASLQHQLLSLCSMPKSTCNQSGSKSLLQFAVHIITCQMRIPPDSSTGISAHAAMQCSHNFPVLLPQVMRSKLASQTQPLPAVSLTSRGDMLLRCQGMFAASLQQVHAATRELHTLQRFMRFHATGEHMAWAAASEMQP